MAVACTGPALLCLASPKLSPVVLQELLELHCCAGEATATDRLFRAAGLQPVAIREEQWQGLTTLQERQAYLRSLLPAGVLLPGRSASAAAAATAAESSCPCPA